jgi:hypothetical protein
MVHLNPLGTVLAKRRDKVQKAPSTFPHISLNTSKSYWAETKCKWKIIKFYEKFIHLVPQLVIFNLGSRVAFSM